MCDTGSKYALQPSPIQQSSYKYECWACQVLCRIVTVTTICCLVMYYMPDKAGNTKNVYIVDDDKTAYNISTSKGPNLRIALGMSWSAAGARDRWVSQIVQGC